MPRNGSGTYALPSGYLATAGQTATAAQHNDPLEDLQTDMNTARPVVAGGTGANNATDARTNLGVTQAISDVTDGTTQINPDLGTSTQYDGTTLVGRPLTDGETNTLGKGFAVTTYSMGTITSGTLTPDFENGNQQKFTCNGAMTLAAPSGGDGTMIVKVTMGASAGTLSLSGFADQSGDAFTTTEGDTFVCYITMIDSDALINIKVYG